MAETSISTRILQGITHDGLGTERLGVFSSGHARVAGPAVHTKRVIVAASRVEQGIVAGAARVADAGDPFA